MTDPEIGEMLERIQFLRGLPEGVLAKLAGLCRVVSFPSGALIFRQGDPAETLYLIEDGLVALEICAASVGCKRILTVGEGELLGWSPVLEQERLTATARALTQTIAVAVPGQQILAVCESDPAFGYHFMKRAAMALAKRLNATRLQLLDVYGTEMPRVPDERPADAGVKTGEQQL